LGSGRGEAARPMGIGGAQGVAGVLDYVASALPAWLRADGAVALLLWRLEGELALALGQVAA
jgi:hypothetical protein